MRNYKDLSKIIHPDGYIFIIILAVITLILWSMSIVLGVICSTVTLYCAYFFRNPDRVIPINPGLVVSPADGIIHSIQSVEPPCELSEIIDTETKMIRVSIFLNIFNVHINRVAIGGRILNLRYKPGKFINASLDKSSTDNERQSVVIETNTGQKIILVQIAGLIARRIICDLEEGNEVLTGQRYGLIRFGSRVDLYLPADTKILADVNQTSIAGETIIADLCSEHISSDRNFDIR
ncbi:phosphatidylserine decarboxylase [Rickettsia endosymbiont of Cardiosporidium cionae]|uniref:phosphatidylserine decarboxylase n=1 Tax=Rickettsia endosymbiont of Cardiosporidium cionae TaxID=2777155 RepID=UPI001893CDD4|nr:phosphatidylserine decarboxylase [Rickettsia endosymbiont of Cardiosporidium cionae]